MPRSELLSRHRILHAADLGGIQARLARDYCPHELRPLAGERAAGAEFRRARLARLAVNVLRYGADVAIEPGAFETFYMVELPLAGRAAIRYGEQPIDSRAGQGVVLSPFRPVSSTWSADCTRLMIQLPRGALEAYLGELLDARPRAPLEFEPALDTATPNGRALRRILLDLAGQLDAGAELSGVPFFPGQCERMIMAALLALQRHNYSDALAAAADEHPCAPGYVRRAQAYIEAHFAEDLSSGDIAAAAHVSQRSLFEGFKRYLGASPMAVVKQRRLAAARQELKAAEPGTDVKTVAYRWGFVHLGRFAQEYRRRYGENPSETLRQR